MTAFQALGPFISTFADSNITALLHNDNGEIVITDRELLAQRLDDLERLREEKRAETEANPPQAFVPTSPSQSLQVETSSTSSSCSSSSTAEDTTAVAAKTDCDEASVEEPVIAEEALEEATIADDDMDLSSDDKQLVEHLEEAAEEEDSTKVMMFHSRSEGDLSLEEERAKAYSQANNENNNEGITSSESYNNFLFWREPVQVLEDLIENAEEAKSPEADDDDSDVKQGTFNFTLYNYAMLCMFVAFF
jgi:hypothetical protein